jgi:hypothetical protein
LNFEPIFNPFYRFSGISLNRSGTILVAKSIFQSMV